MSDTGGVPVVFVDGKPVGCSLRDRRARMTDDEFWADVAERLGACDPEDEEPEVDLVPLLDEPCAVCGSNGACAVDSEGRAMIHVTEVDD